MLNELKQIADSVSSVADSGLHPWIENLPNMKDALIVDINLDGSIKRIFTPTDEMWEKLKYCTKSNHKRFPLLNLKPFTDEKTQKGNVKKFTHMHNFLKEVILDQTESPSNWLQFFKAVSKMDSNHFVQHIVSQFLNKWDSEKKLPETFQVFLRTTECEEDLMSQKSWTKIDNILKNISDEKIIDAFGMSGAPLETFSSIKIPGGIFRPYSRNKETKCYSRYGLKAAQCFPFSTTLEQYVSDALRWITDEEREGLTWNRHVIGEKNNDQILTLAMVEGTEEIHKECQKVISFLAFSDEKIKKVEKRKETNRILSHSKPVIEAAKGLLNRKDELHGDTVICSFYIPDRGASTILYFKRAKSTEIVQKVIEWNKYCQFSIRQACRIINKQWTKKAGFVKKEVEVSYHRFVNLHEMYSMVLDGNQAVAQKVINALSHDHVHLMLDVANRIHLDPSHKWTKAGKLIKDRYDFFKIVDIVKYLLRNDDKNTAYNFGKLCKMSTKLYRCYRLFKEKSPKIKRTPGIEAIYRAFGNPVTAHLYLLKRMLVSYKILTSIKNSKEFDGTNVELPPKTESNHWKWRESMVYSNDLPTKLNSIERLQMALGYIEG